MCRQIQELQGKTDRYSYYVSNLSNSSLLPLSPLRIRWANRIIPINEQKKFEFLSMFEVAGNLEMAHLLQFPASFQSRKFNYKTRQENINAYGQETPPIYNLSSITQPGIHLYAGNSDRFVSVEDVKITSSQLTGKF